MAELRSSTSIGGNLAWHTGNLRFDTQGNTIRFAGYKLYSENDLPTSTELNVVSKSGDIMTGNLSIQTTSTTAAIEIGRIDGVASTPFIDFHAGATPTDYDARIIAYSGNGVAATGGLRIEAGNVDMSRLTVPTLVGTTITAATVTAPTFTGALVGNSSTATKLATARTLTYTGHATGSGTYDGSANTNIALTLAASGAAAGNYKSVTVDTYGRVTAGTNPTTLAGYGITDALNLAGGTLTGALAGTYFKTNDAAAASNYGDANYGFYVYGTPASSISYGMTLIDPAANAQWGTNIFAAGESNRFVYFTKKNGASSAYTSFAVAAKISVDTGEIYAAGGTKQVLHTGNYTTTLDSRYVQKTGDSMSGTLTTPEVVISGTTGVSITKGTIDGATSASANVQFKSWYGIGFAPTISGTPVPLNENAVWINVRSGDLSARGTITAPVFSGALSGNASSASVLATPRTLTIGASGKAFNGSANAAWTLAEIGALPLAGGVMTGEITINTNSIRGANGTAIVKDHGNGNTTFSGSRNASSVAGDLYLGYHDNANHFTNKVILHQSMYANNTSLQIINSTTGELFDRGSAVIGANRGNVLNNSSFGVGFLSSADAGAPWISGYFGKNGGANQVVVGELGGNAVIGAHNAAKTAWADLYIGMQSTGGGNNVTHISMPHARISGNATSFPIYHTGNFNPDTKLDNNGSGGTLTLNNWFRSIGQTGWYNADYGGGIWMTDTTWVRVSHNKQFYVDNTASNSINTTGGVTASVSMTAPTFNGTLNGNASTSTYASWANALSTLDANPNSRLNSGSYQNSTASTANGWPVSTNTWMHLLTSTHSNDSNYYSMQIAASFYNNTQLYYRSTNGNGGTGWAQIWTSAVFDPNTKANLSGATFTGNVTAPTFNGLALNSFTAASTIVVRDATGDINCRLLRPEFADGSFMDGAIAFRSSASTSNNYLRFCNDPAAVRSWLGAPSLALATTSVNGLMSYIDKTYINNTARTKHPSEYILWSGEAGANTASIAVTNSLYGYSAIRFEGINADKTIAWTHTLAAHEWNVMCNSGYAILVGSAAGYYWVFKNQAVNGLTLTRHLNNVYLTKIVGLF